jgi:hypothetical protein
MILQEELEVTGNLIIWRRRFRMNPVVGLDVSKGESEVQGFLDKGKPYRKSFSIRHDLEGLGLLLE